MSEVTPSNSAVDRSERDNRTLSDSNFACLARDHIYTSPTGKR